MDDEGENSALPEFRVSFPGPFSQHEVVVDGWRVPLVHAQVHDENEITIVLDNRIGLELTTAASVLRLKFVA